MRIGAEDIRIGPHYSLSAGIAIFIIQLDPGSVFGICLQVGDSELGRARYAVQGDLLFYGLPARRRLQEEIIGDSVKVRWDLWISELPPVDYDGVMRGLARSQAAPNQRYRIRRGRGTWRYCRAGTGVWIGWGTNGNRIAAA